MNYRMTVYILGKMLGVEGLVLFIPMIVAMIYREDSFIYFPITECDFDGNLSFLWKKKTEKYKHLYERWLGDCCSSVAVVVYIWSVTVFLIRKYSKLCRCII